ncbi:hypothetical protein NDU88_004666 [Pleurodeles waltl]|uniref:Uncharacterized protein n=1 Tax=Pleurodeles waltl TaxID=8319 RepID=A0AAV7WW15_PLEWA|nr:hypothetical protein NDU88_004666 [Pleurodeles waltl]
MVDSPRLPMKRLHSDSGWHIRENRAIDKRQASGLEMNTEASDEETAAAYRKAEKEMLTLRGTSSARGQGIDNKQLLDRGLVISWAAVPWHWDPGA